VGIKATYSFWKLLKPMLETASTSLGKIAMNEGTGIVTVTDTRDALNKIERIIHNETSILGQQVIIDVRILRVDLNKGSEAGVDLSSVYNVLSADGINNSTANFTPPATRTTANAGNLTFALNNALSRFNGSKTVIQGLNQFGTVVSDSSSSVITTNRVPAMAGSFKTVGFLAQTVSIPSTVAGGTSTPGLLPGSITTGSFLRILPTIRENNTIMISMSADISDLVEIGSASTGSGSTLQQIQWANTTGTKSIGNLLLNQDESMVMVGLGGSNDNNRTNNGIGGASTSRTTTKSMFVVIVSPRILKSI
jgi:type IVB pilus formation R64 PilN family outer membrane protein